MFAAAEPIGQFMDRELSSGPQASEPGQHPIPTRRLLPRRSTLAGENDDSIAEGFSTNWQQKRLTVAISENGANADLPCPTS